MSETIEVKTCDLEGPALDWAVGCIEDEQIDRRPIGWRFMNLKGWVLLPDTPYFDIVNHWSPSTNWSQGGPLITKFLIEFRVEHERTICSYLCDANGMYISDGSYGDTHLIAACRAIVTAKLGETVNVPAELIK